MKTIATILRETGRNNNAMTDHHTLSATVERVRAREEEVRIERATRLHYDRVAPEINWYTAADDVLGDGYTVDELASIVAEGIDHVVGNVFEREKMALLQIARRIVRTLAAPEVFDDTVQMHGGNSTTEMPVV